MRHCGDGMDDIVGTRACEAGVIAVVLDGDVAVVILLMTNLFSRLRRAIRAVTLYEVTHRRFALGRFVDLALGIFSRRFILEGRGIDALRAVRPYGRILQRE